MFDIGGWEFLIIVVVAIIIVGPKDLPGALRTVTSWIRKAKALTNDFRNSIDDLAEEVELENISNELHSDLGIDETKDLGSSIHEHIKESIDPNDEISEAVNEASSIYYEDINEKGEATNNLVSPTKSIDQQGELNSSLEDDKKPNKGDEN